MERSVFCPEKKTALMQRHLETHLIQDQSPRLRNHNTNTFSEKRLKWEIAGGGAQNSGLCGKTQKQALDWW